MNAEKKINHFLRLVLLIVVLPLLATVVFSKLLLSKENIFEGTYVFRVKNSYANYVGVKCSDNTCTIPNIDTSGAKASKGSSGTTNFTSTKSGLDVLEKIRTELLNHLPGSNKEDCLKNPILFAKDILIQDLEYELIPQDLKKYLIDILTLSKFSSEDEIKEKSKMLCLRTVERLSSDLMTGIELTYENEMKQLKLVAMFYMALTFLAFFIFYLYPNYKNRSI